MLTVFPNGLLTAAGELADGTKFSQGAALAGTDEWPFYVALDAGRSSAIGRLRFRTVTAVSDLDGTVNWFRSAHPKAAPFAAAFTAPLPAIGCRYPAAPGQPAVLGTLGQKVDLTLTGGGLPASGLDLPFTFGNAGVAIFDHLPRPAAINPVVDRWPHLRVGHCPWRSEPPPSSMASPFRFSLAARDTSSGCRVAV